MEAVKQVLPSFKERLVQLAQMHGDAEVVGLPESQITAAEKRLGFALPEPLKELYLTIGGHKAAMEAFHPISSPEELVNYTGVEEDEHPGFTEEQMIALGGDLVIAFENQGCWSLRYNAQSGKVYFDMMTGDDDLPADDDATADPFTKSHIVLGHDLEQALIWIVAQQCFNSDSGELSSGEFDVPAGEIDDFFAKLKTYCIEYTSDFGKSCGNVYFNPELKLVITGSVSPRNGSFFGWVALADTESNDDLSDFEQTFGVEVSYF